MQNPPLLIEITVNPSDPELLEGLDVWLRLGLISEEQLRQLSQTHLSCPLPEPLAVASVEGIEGSERSKTDFASQAILLKGKAPLTKFRNFFAQAWQAFKDELSVRWLLFLGLFLVVASSGVLAATQWERFPDPGQYLVLLTYTLIFWGVGFWASKQENLPLTSQTLKAITLLLVPVNFWAMDAFDLWEHFGEWFAVAIASISLTSLYYLYSKPRQSLFLFFNFIGLCYLHWGWGFSEFPLIAVYFGAIATGIVIRCLPAHLVSNPVEYPQRKAGEQGGQGGKGTRGQGDKETRNKGKTIPNPKSKIHLRSSDDSLNPAAIAGTKSKSKIQNPKSNGWGVGERGLVVYALSVLLIRAIFVVHLPIQKFGLAIGICGWLLQGQRFKVLGRQNLASGQNFSQLLEGIGAILLLLGWLVSFTEQIPWQATAVSGLALHFFAQRLGRDWLRRDLLAVFLIGLQALLLILDLLPVQLRSAVMDLSIQISHSEAFPQSVYSIILFPYVIVFVCLTDWLYRQAKFKLARFGEWLTLGLGIGLTLVGVINPTWRSLNFLLSTSTLAWFTHRRLPIRLFAIYFTHILGLLTIC